MKTGITWMMLLTLGALVFDGCIVFSDQGILSAPVPVELIIPFEALQPTTVARDTCSVGLVRHSLPSFIKKTYPSEERADQYRVRVLDYLEEIVLGEDFVDVFYSNNEVGRASRAHLFFIHTCLSDRGSYTCPSVSLARGLEATTTCKFTAFEFAPGEKPSDSPSVIEIDYGVEACRSGRCDHGWRMWIDQIRRLDS